MKIPFKRGNILLPKNTDMTKWSVVACDQYTSEPEYWNSVKEIVGENPSTLNLTLPEIYLEENDVDERIKKINENMETLVNSDFFNEYKNSMIYLERTQADGKIREGLMGIVDLEDYSYEKGSETLIRATEKTVIERIPPRKKVRINAPLELPHIMILIDDEKREIIESLKNKVSSEDVIYDFDLMLNGGHSKGYKLSGPVIDEVTKKLEDLGEINYFNNKYGVNEEYPCVYAMGDGNHSLATAKSCYEEIKRELGEEEALKHPSRYALVELVNIHSDALDFEPIHRVIFDCDVEHLLTQMYKRFVINTDGNGQKLTYITSAGEKTIYIEDATSNLAVGTLQSFLDDYLQEFAGKIDYIHGEDATRELASKQDNIGFLLPKMEKSDLFKSVILDGALPRKTFSMGHSDDKRFYFECRKIK